MERSGRLSQGAGSRNRRIWPRPPISFWIGPALSHVSQQYVGRYRLLNQLRYGKTCQVWEVMKDITGERMAIKLLLSEYRKDRQEVGFMRHEFEVGNKLNHPRVIKIYEFGVDRDNVFLAMELFPAPNIKQVIQQNFDFDRPLGRSGHRPGRRRPGLFPRARLDPSRRQARQLPDEADGRREADRFCPGPAPPQRADEVVQPWRRQDSRHAQLYVARADSRPALDERADLYSFGCMVFELVSGKPPFTGSTTPELLNKHLNTAVPAVQGANREVSDPLAQLIKRMLAKKPEDRPRNCRRVFEGILAHAGLQGPLAGTGRRAKFGLIRRRWW